MFSTIMNALGVNTAGKVEPKPTKAQVNRVTAMVMESVGLGILKTIEVGIWDEYDVVAYNPSAFLFQQLRPERVCYAEADKSRSDILDALAKLTYKVVAGPRFDEFRESANPKSASLRWLKGIERNYEAIGSEIKSLKDGLSIDTAIAYRRMREKERIAALNLFPLDSGVTIRYTSEGQHLVYKDGRGTRVTAEDRRRFEADRELDLIHATHQDLIEERAGRPFTFFPTADCSSKQKKRRGYRRGRDYCYDEPQHTEPQALETMFLTEKEAEIVLDQIKNQCQIMSNYEKELDEKDGNDRRDPVKFFVCHSRQFWECSFNGNQDRSLIMDGNDFHHVSYHTDKIMDFDCARYAAMFNQVVARAARVDVEGNAYIAGDAIFDIIDRVERRWRYYTVPNVQYDKKEFSWLKPWKNFNN